MSDILFYSSDYVITIYVITSLAIIATPSVRRTVPRCVRFSPSGGHTSDIPRTYSGQTPDTSMDTGHNPGLSGGRSAGRYRGVNTQRLRYSKGFKSRRTYRDVRTVVIHFYHLNIGLIERVRKPSWSLQCNIDSDKAFYCFIIQKNWLLQKQQNIIFF